MVYLNNAATSYPKPPTVVQAVVRALEARPMSALRSSLADAEDLTQTLRQNLASLIHVSHPDRIFLNSGATDSLNRLIGGLSYNRAIVTTDNHNSVLRPIENLKRTEIDYIEKTEIIEKLEKTEKSGLFILPHCSNVTGAIHDIAAICAKAHRKGLMVVLDASQSAGCIPIQAEEWGVDIIVFTGHKALFGPQGTGGFYIRPGISLRPTLFGGTGRDSSVIRYERDDWEYEVGTPNMPGLAGLRAGVEYVLQEGVGSIFEQLQAKTQWLIAQLKCIPKVSLYVQGEESHRQKQGPIVSFNIEGLKPSDVGYILQNVYGITTRTGLHCAPLIHRQLGTAPWGTVRVSLSHLTTDEDLQTLTGAIHDISKGL